MTLDHAQEVLSDAVPPPEPEQAADPQKRAGSGAIDVAALAVDLAHGAQWPGGALGALGSAVILGAVISEEILNRLTSTEFVAILVVGALLALAGPLVVAYTTTGARRDAVEVDVADKKAQEADKKAKEKEEERKRVELEIRLEQLRRE